MNWAETIHTMAGGDVLRWSDVTRLPLTEFFFKLKFLTELNKKHTKEMRQVYK